MLPKNRIPTHPAEVLLEEFLKPLGISQVALAEPGDGGGRRRRVPLASFNQYFSGNRQGGFSDHCEGSGDLIWGDLRESNTRGRIRDIQRHSGTRCEFGAQGGANPQASRRRRTSAVVFGRLYLSGRSNGPREKLQA